MSELADAQATLADAQQGWRIEAPQVLGLYQEIDGSRLERLKELFAKWQTSSGDIERDRLEGCERRLNGLIGWDLDADLTDFLAKSGSAGGPPSAAMGDRSRQVSGMSVATRAQSQLFLCLYCLWGEVKLTLA